MSIEDRLSESLTRNLDQLDVSAGNPSAAQQAGDRLRRRTRRTVGIAAAASLAVVATVAGLALRTGGDERLDPAPTIGSWARLPDAPISPRTGGIAAWTGTEAIFLGGEIDNLCPPNASCVSDSTRAKDGAAYNPTTGTWRKITPAPITIGNYTPYAFVGDTLVIVDVVSKHNVWHAYDLGENTWRRLPDPPVKASPTNNLSVLDGKIYTVASDFGVEFLDLGTETWTTLPRSEHQPRIAPQAVLATPPGIVVTGLESSVTAPNDGSEPMWVFAEIYQNGDWRRLERSDMVGGYTWHWTGQRLVSLDIQCVDGGEVDPYGSCIPQGGTLDPATGVWGRLPNAPDPEHPTGEWSLIAQDGPLMAGWGYVYDDAAGTWARLPRPDDAPDNAAAAVWAEGMLIAFGGIHSGQGWDTDALSNAAWLLTP